MASSRMVTEIDLYRCANVLIREHGEDANIEAPIPTNVRYGSFADMQQGPRERPLPGAKQTYLGQPRVGRRVYGKEPGVRLVWVNWPRLARGFLYVAEPALCSQIVLP